MKIFDGREIGLRRTPPRPPTPPCAAEVHFAPDPGLIAAADAAVREAVDERLRERVNRSWWTPAAMPREGTSHQIERESRYLEQRARREARTGGEKNDGAKGDESSGRMIRVGEMDRGDDSKRWTPPNARDQGTPPAIDVPN